MIKIESLNGEVPRKYNLWLCEEPRIYFGLCRRTRGFVEQIVGLRQALNRNRQAIIFIRGVIKNLRTTMINWLRRKKNSLAIVVLWAWLLTYAVQLYSQFSPVISHLSHAHSDFWRNQPIRISSACLLSLPSSYFKRPPSFTNKYKYQLP